MTPREMRGLSSILSGVACLLINEDNKKANTVPKVMLLGAVGLDVYRLAQRIKARKSNT